MAIFFLHAKKKRIQNKQKRNCFAVSLIGDKSIS